MGPANRPSFLECGELSLLLFGGKGGVGKTTCAVAAALDLARCYPDRTFLLASIDPAHSLNDCLENALLPVNLHTQEIDFRVSLEKFKDVHARHFREIALRGTFLDEDDVQRLLDLTTPGFDELMAFIDIATLLQEHSYSCVVVDTAPTGHTLRFLELPDLMHEWLGVFDAMLEKHRYLTELYRPDSPGDETDTFLDEFNASIQFLTNVLSDAASCRFIPVMLAETMSTNETDRLVARLKELNISVHDILVNRLYPAGSSCPVCRSAERRQQQELRRMVSRFANYALWGIPLQGGQIQGSEQLAHLWDRTDRISAPGEPPPETVSLPPRVERSARMPASEARLLLFAGKGGVGKTTLACATAAYLAREHPGKKVLLFSTDPAHSLADCFDVNIGAREVALAPGLTAMEVDATAELEKLKHHYVSEVEEFFNSLAENSGMDLAFDHDVVERMLDLSPPGLDEMMAMVRIVDFVAAAKYDLFILDTAPTGHLIRLLEMPELIEKWLRTTLGLFSKYKSILRFPRIMEFLVDLSRKVTVLRRLLADPQQGQLFAVSILTEMAYEETKDLLSACRNANVHVPVLFLNLVTPPSACELCSAVVATETPVRKKYESTFGTLPETLVYRCGEPRGLERLAKLGQALYAN
jgi:arsenite/tail-anchored protein-transporting ATPase